MKKFDVNEGIWFLILAGYAYLIYELVSLDKLKLFIHPKMNYYVYFGFAVFFLLALYQLPRLIRHKNSKTIRWGYFMFALPLFLAFLVKPEELSAQLITNKGMDIVRSNEVETVSTIEEEEENSLSSDGMIEYAEYDGYYGYEAFEEYDWGEEENVFEPSPESEEFLEKIYDVYSGFEDMVGEEIELTGFVYKDQDLDEKQFVLAWLFMSCCAADAQASGFLCELEDTLEYKEEEWIRVSGTIESTMVYDAFYGEEYLTPIIKVKSIRKVDKPNDPYVYF